jgi:hypothetical protein
MEHLNLLEEALNKATQKGAYNLKETEMIITSIIQLRKLLEADVPKLETKK